MAKPSSVPDKMVAGDSAAASGPGPHLSWRERRDWFRAQLQKRPLAHIGEDEVEMHFIGMPARYWERMTENDLGWGLETIHSFLKIITTPNIPGTAPVVDWRSDPQPKSMRVMLCTWDRHGLLAKCAACFSAVKLNILQADVYTRTDNVVLDVFGVSDAGNHSSADSARMQELTFLLDGALSEPPRFASVWACSRHKLLAPPPRIPPRISFENDLAADSTVVRVEASDRLGLLYDVLQALADSGLNIVEARIETDDDVARDTIYITDSRGQKISDRKQLDELRRRLHAALTVTE